MLWLHPSSKKSPKWKGTRMLGLVRASPAWIFCGAMVQVAALWCTKWFWRLVTAPLACPRTLSTWMLQRLFVVIPSFLDLSVTQNAHGYYPCLAAPAASYQVQHSFFFPSWFSSPEQCFHYFLSIPRIVKTLIFSLKLVNTLKGGRKKSPNPHSF